MRALFQRSHGVPRLINIIADRALLAAFASERTDINARLVHAAADEIQLGEPGARRSLRPWVIAAAAGLVLASGAWWLLERDSGSLPDPAQVAVEPAAQVREPTVPRNEAAPAKAAPVMPVEIDPNWLQIQHRAAWQGLAALWGDSDDGDAIAQACRSGEVTGGWACLKENGSFARISQLGLPVILQLQTPTESLLLLQGLDPDAVLAGAPGTEQTHKRSVVEQDWLGAYFVAWPQAANWPREIRRGQSGPAVVTVVELASLGEPPYRGRAEFGGELEQWLLGFQRRNGLDADGIVGPRTLLYLMRPSITRPLLRHEW